jgi:hypothetical protein
VVISLNKHRSLVAQILEHLLANDGSCNPPRVKLSTEYHQVCLQTFHRRDRLIGFLTGGSQISRGATKLRSRGGRGKALITLFFSDGRGPVWVRWALGVSIGIYSSEDIVIQIFEAMDSRWLYKDRLDAEVIEIVDVKVKGVL